MIQAIGNFRDNSNQFSHVSDAVRETWQDCVGERFYNAIIYPLQDLSSIMATDMEDLSSTLLRIKEKIDAI